MPSLIETLKDGESWIRQYAADALGEIGPDARAAVPSLIEAMKDEKSWIRHTGAEALEKI